MTHRAPLAQESCRPLGPQDRLAGDALAALMAQVPQWQVIDGSLQRSLRFPDFHRTMAFVNAAAFVAHQQDHHPDLSVGYDHCTLRFSTHSAGGLTRNDVICAARIDALLA
ncbi:MAG: 4a-hydroxytetrahydrobiopterin dehydratase [Aquabacterium sp.]